MKYAVKMESRLKNKQKRKQAVIYYDILKSSIGVLFHIRDIIGSSLGLETGYTKMIIFVVYLSCSRKISGPYFTSDHDHFLPYCSEFIIYL
jgi:hypothetical protein